MAYQFVPLHGWRVLAADIALPQPVLTDDVRDIEKMEFVGNVGLVDQGTHPAAPLHKCLPGNPERPKGLGEGCQLRAVSWHHELECHRPG